MSAAPWATINGDSEYQQKTLLEGRNRAIAVSFNEWLPFETGKLDRICCFISTKLLYSHVHNYRSTKIYINVQCCLRKYINVQCCFLSIVLFGVENLCYHLESTQTLMKPKQFAWVQFPALCVCSPKYCPHIQNLMKAVLCSRIQHNRGTSRILFASICLGKCQAGRVSPLHCLIACVYHWQACCSVGCWSLCL